MPKQSQKEDWFNAIRTFIIDTLGNKNCQLQKVNEMKGKTRNKVCIHVVTK